MLGSSGLCSINCLKGGTAALIEIVNKMGPRSALSGSPPSRQVPPGWSLPFPSLLKLFPCWLHDW